MLNGKDVNIIPPGTTVTFEMFSKYSSLCLKALEKKGTIEKTYKAYQNLNVKKLNLQEISKQTSTSVDKFCDSSKDTMIMDVFCKEGINKNDIEVDRIEGRYPRLENMDIDDMKNKNDLLTKVNYKNER